MRDVDKIIVSMTPKPGDMKAGVGKKPQVAYMSPAALNYMARGHQYGAEKYAMGNYLRAAPEGTTDLMRLFEYYSALIRHAAAGCDSIIRFLGEGRNAVGTEARAAFAKDLESGLPALCHIGATYSMMVQQAVDAGLLPFDPGTPWKENK